MLQYGVSYIFAQAHFCFRSTNFNENKNPEHHHNILSCIILPIINIS